MAGYPVDRNWIYGTYYVKLGWVIFTWTVQSIAVINVIIVHVVMGVKVLPVQQMFSLLLLFLKICVRC